MTFTARAEPPTALNWTLTENRDAFGPVYGQATAAHPVEVEAWWDRRYTVLIVFSVDGQHAEPATLCWIRAGDG